MNRMMRSLLIHRVLAVAAVIAAAPWAAQPALASISDCIDATCRITTPDGSCGTGCAFEIGHGRVYVLTAAHVTGTHSTVQCEFWRQGHRSQPLSGSVIARIENGRCDAAIVSLAASQFGGLLPKAVPIAPRGTILRQQQTITSVGCAKGAWSTGWKGHVLRVDDNDLHFRPTPADGRSGSAIFDAEGTMIVGLLRARTLDSSEGIACSLQSLYTYLGSPAAYTRRQNVQHGSSGCPGGICPSPSPHSTPLPPQPSSRQYLLPYRHEQQQRQNPVWPTLPAQAAPPLTIDLDTTNDKLDGLTEKVDDLIVEIRTDRRSRADVRPELQSMPAVPRPAEDSEALQAAEVAKADALAAKQQLETTRQEQSKLKQMIDSLIGDRETLKERFDARIAKVKQELGEDAGRLDVARAYARDLVAEKLSGGAGWTLGKVLALSLGMGGPMALAIAAAGFFVARRIGTRIEAGEPLLIQRVFDRLGDKIDDLKDRLHDGKSAAVATRRKAR